MIELQEVTKNFRDVTAIRGLSCTFPENRVVGIIGANGSGKTTMMRLISSIMCPTSGKVLVNQLDTAVQPHEIKKDIGFRLVRELFLCLRMFGLRCYRQGESRWKTASISVWSMDIQTLCSKTAMAKC